ncbi:MAG: DUF1015 domain-containing protein [Lachnospiraceae bacterium]|nr:DUF1015 domain-containing protein [Lachnospiraceae bacterium]
MADIRPFRALHPESGFGERIAALPYDVYHREEARVLTQKEPLSFLRIDRGETNFPPGYDMYAPEVYEKCGSLLQEWIEKKYLTQEEESRYFIYELTMNGRVQTGVVGVASVDDYCKNRIRKHENTREEKEQDRIRHIRGCQAQTGPIYLTFRDHRGLSVLMAGEKCGEALFDITFEDGIRHRIFAVKDPKKAEEIRKAFLEIPRLYIADGHHRCASAARVCQDWREGQESYEESASVNYFLCVLFPQSELEIMPYHRSVKDLYGYTPETFLKKLAERFEVTPQREPYQPKKCREFGMYFQKQWYRLKYHKDPLESENPAENLDVSLLQKDILEPILGIGEPRTDSRIDFIGGIRGLQALEEKAEEGWAVSFSLKATTMEELFAVADAELLMPPKSTWFEPKLRSGFFIHRIDT